MTLNEIKDRIYEAEGLLELLRLRGEKLDELRPLVLARLDEARRALIEFGNDETPMKGDTPMKEVTPMKEETEPKKVTETKVDTLQEDNAPLYAVVNDETVGQKADSEVISQKTVNMADKKAVKPAFCLNDRFRFRRSIFGGSDADFNAAMDYIATLDSYEEAEEMFYGDMDLNPESPDVIDFMNIIKEYFGR